MGQRGEHLRSEAGSSRYEREERESLEALADADREDAAAEARAWAERLGAERVSLRDQSRSVVLNHVGKLSAEVSRLALENEALRKSEKKHVDVLNHKIKLLRSDVSHLKDRVRNLLRYRPAA
jgi:hypothetical protein